MSARATNLAIFALLLLELASGVGSYLTGGPDGAWVLWVHGIGGMTLIVLLVWKWRIVMRSFMRQGAGLWALPSALLGVLFLATLAVGLLWVLGAAPEAPIPGYGSMRPMVLHAVLAVVLVIPFATHASAHWPRVKPADMASRRAALRTIALGGAGFVLWRGLDVVSDGHRRRPALHRLARGGELHRQRPPTDELARRPAPAPQPRGLAPPCPRRRAVAIRARLRGHRGPRQRRATRDARLHGRLAHDAGLDRCAPRRAARRRRRGRGGTQRRRALGHRLLAALPDG